MAMKPMGRTQVWIPLVWIHWRTLLLCDYSKVCMITSVLTLADYLGQHHGVCL